MRYLKFCLFLSLLIPLYPSAQNLLNKPEHVAWDPINHRYLVATTSGQYDGIMRDTNGDLYVTSWMSGGRVYKWERHATNGS